MSTPAPVPSQASPRIFVSHSHADDAFGLRLVADLRVRLGEDAVWYDSSGGLHGGDEWWNHIVAELTARDTFIAIFSPDSVVSKWVIDEINIAWALRHRIGTRIIPILARPCDLRSDWLLLQYVSFVAPRPYDEAFAELLGVLGIPNEQVAQPAPVAAAPPTPLAQLVVRLTQEIHAAFGQEAWRTVVERSDLLLKEDPQGMTPALWRERGLAYLSLGDSQAALGALDEVLQVDPFDIATLHSKGLALRQSGRGKEAVEVLERAYQLAPFTDPLQRLTLLGDLAEIQRGDEDWGGALQTIDEALRLAPDDPVWLRARLEALAQLGREEETNALARDWAPRHLAVVNQWLQERYQHHLQAEAWTLARATVATGLAVAPGYRVWQQAQVEVARRSGQVEEALTLARQMAASSGATIDDWVSLAALAAAANREEEVKTALAGAAALSGPDDAAVLQARKDYLVPLETAREQARTTARRTRRDYIVVGVSMLLLVAMVVTLVSLGGVWQRAQVEAAATSDAATATTESNAQATATAVSTIGMANATYTAVPHTGYSAPIPGQCGSDRASWTDDSNTTVTCTSAGEVVTLMDNGLPPPDGPQWSGPGGHGITFSYTVQVDITHLSQQSCAGVNVSSNSTDDKATYYFLVCSDSSWQITNQCNILGNCPNPLTFGTTRAASTYHLKVTLDRNSQDLSINGVNVGTTFDPAYSGTGLLSLVVVATGSDSGTNASATFSHFTYMPLPTS